MALCLPARVGLQGGIREETMSDLQPEEQERESTVPLKADGEIRAARRVLWLFAMAHLIVWTALPIIIYGNAPLDVVEMRYLGGQWMLGNHKHPPLASWMGESAALVFGGSTWGVYLIAQVAMVCVFWAVCAWDARCFGRDWPWPALVF